MSSLADYYVLRRNRFILATHVDIDGNRFGGSRRLEFRADSDIIQSGGTRRPYLTFFANPTSDAEQLRIYIRINGENIFSYRYSGGIGRTHVVVFDHGILARGQPNYIHFVRRVNTNNGPETKGLLWISDLVLWYQRDIHT